MNRNDHGHMVSLSNFQYIAKQFTYNNINMILIQIISVKFQPSAARSSCLPSILIKLVHAMKFLKITHFTPVFCFLSLITMATLSAQAHIYFLHSHYFLLQVELKIFSKFYNNDVDALVCL